MNRKEGYYKIATQEWDSLIELKNKVNNGDTDFKALRQKIERISPTPIDMEQGSTNIQTIPYQLCPKCHGQGTVSKPPYIAGDVFQWSSTSALHVCDVCNGAKVILQYAPPIETMQYLWRNTSSINEDMVKAGIDITPHIAPDIPTNDLPSVEVSSQPFEYFPELCNSIQHGASFWMTDTEWSNHLACINEVCSNLLRTRTSTVGVSDEEIASAAALFVLSQPVKKANYLTDLELRMIMADYFFKGYKQSITDRAGFTESDVLAFAEWISLRHYRHNPFNKMWSGIEKSTTLNLTTAQLFSAYLKEKNNG